ncbi:hypothetical protein V6N13_061029 [Hibiscus sabdariffa]|uniref:Secreted protein n=1 Tax=Hibiscus sabdariffa TaxID=183260 RepID=A0ABR2AYV1_9ROSI
MGLGVQWRIRGWMLLSADSRSAPMGHGTVAETQCFSVLLMACGRCGVFGFCFVVQLRLLHHWSNSSMTLP